MHVYTLVITPGPRRSAVRRAEALLDEAVPRSFDYYGTAGRFSHRLGGGARPEIDEWYAAEAVRRAAFEAENPAVQVPEPDELRDADDPLDVGDLREFVWDADERPHRERLRRLHAEALVDLTLLTSDLPSPLPDTIVPAALVTPDGSWRMRPSTWEQGDPRWARWVNERVDRYRGGHCVVVADCHC